MTKTIEVIKEVTVTIDDENIENMLTDYRECISEDADIDEVFKQIGWSIATSDSSFVEGCGTDGEDFTIEANETISVEIT